MCRGRFVKREGKGWKSTGEKQLLERTPIKGGGGRAGTGGKCNARMGSFLGVKYTDELREGQEREGANQKKKVLSRDDQGN